MSLSVRTRFEVFKRDRFTCSYCGRTPPEVLLEVDHIVPRAAGGTDDISNLTTACATCNRGKAARLLEEGTAPVVGRATVEELAERVEQAKAYMELVGGLQAVTDQQVGVVYAAWARAFGATEDGDKWRLQGCGELWPNEGSVRRFLRRLTLEEVLEAVDIACSRFFGQAGTSPTRYFYGVCNRAIRQSEDARSIVGQVAEPTPPVVTPDPVEEWSIRQAVMEELRGLFLDPVGHGYENVQAVIASLWGDDE